MNFKGPFRGTPERVTATGDWLRGSTRAAADCCLKFRVGGFRNFGISEDTGLVVEVWGLGFGCVFFWFWGFFSF